MWKFSIPLVMTALLSLPLTANESPLLAPAHDYPESQEANSIQHLYPVIQKRGITLEIKRPRFGFIASSISYAGSRNAYRKNNITEEELRDLYSTVLSICWKQARNQEAASAERHARELAVTLFERMNSAFAIRFYGKDRSYRNVGYFYIRGVEKIGIVFFYPDQWNGLFFGAIGGIRTMGWEAFFTNFLRIVKENNTHLEFLSQDGITYQIRYKK